MAPSTVVHVNLALTCVESALYGIFFVLAITSLGVLVARRRKTPNGSSSLSAGGALLRSPLVVGTLLLFITVGGVSGESLVCRAALAKLPCSIGAPPSCAYSNPWITKGASTWEITTSGWSSRLRSWPPHLWLRPS